MRNQAIQHPKSALPLDIPPHGDRPGLPEVEGSNIQHARAIRPTARLDLQLGLRDGITRPLVCMAVPPVQLSRARYDVSGRPEIADFTLLHLGGILAGDAVDLQVVLEPGASARVMMAASTQVYCMPEGEATQRRTRGPPGRARADQCRVDVLRGQPQWICACEDILPPSTTPCPGLPYRPNALRRS